MKQVTESGNGVDTSIGNGINECRKIIANQVFVEALEVLGPREVEVLKMTANNRTSDEIAKELFLSKRTVDKYKEAIRAAVGAKGYGSLRKWCREHARIDEVPTYVE